MEGVHEGLEPGHDEQAGKDEATEANLQQLVQLMGARQRIRTGLKIMFITGFIGWFAGLIFLAIKLITLFLKDPQHFNLASLLLIIPAYACVFGLPFVSYWINTTFYNRFETTVGEVILPLAQSGDERAMGALLDLMDGRMAGAIEWGRAKPLFFEAIALLIPGLTPERFQRLTESQVKLLVTRVRSADPEVRIAMRDMLVRCGDARALRALRRIQVLCARAIKQHQSKPFPAWINWISDKSGSQRLGPSVVEFVTECCDAMEVRIAEETRMAQLLRASDRSEVGSASQLVRPSSMGSAAVRPEESLRAADDPTAQIAAGTLAAVGRIIPVSEPETEKSSVQQTRY